MPAAGPPPDLGRQRTVAGDDPERAQFPTNSGRFVHLQEISGSTRLRGGAGRTRTSSQTVMSEPRRLRTERIFPAYGPRGLKLPARHAGPGAPESPPMSRNVVRGLNI
jgi:hypothetical protein